MSVSHTRFAPLSLPAGALGLRALRPSFRSVLLPVRYVRMGVEGFRRDSTGYNLIPVYNDVPVFVKRTRSQHVQH